MKHHFDTRLLFVKTALTILLALCAHSLHAKIVADFEADFKPEAPKPGWYYLWNPTNVEIGDHVRYQELEEPGGKWRAIVDAELGTGKNGPIDGPWLQLSLTHWSYGSGGSKATDNLNHYVIAAYTFQQGEAGHATIKNSIIQRLKENGDDEIRVYLNDELLGTGSPEGLAPSSFNIDLGQVKKADTLYVAYGPKGNAGGKAKIQFQIDVTK